jgi:xylose dehydrogenase (NAD/NADP)
LDDVCARDWESTSVSSLEEMRFAIIGVGWFTRERVFPALESSDLCTASVVVTRSEEKADRVAESLDEEARGITYDQFHEGVASDEYDAVYIVTPNALHLEYARTAASLGKHVLCEKPMERDSERAETLRAVCADAGIELMIAYRMHTEPAVRRARELIEEGVVGTPVEIRGSMAQRLLDRINPDPDQWRLDAELAGGGALFDIGLYPLNTARYLLDSDPIAVTGRVTSTHDAFSDVDETVQFSLEFPGDVYASCFASHNARQSSEITVVGTEGAVGIEPAFFQDQQRALHVSRGDGRMSVDVTKVDQMQEEFEYFTHQVRTGGDIYADGEHGLVDMRTMETIYDAADERTWVTLE